MSRLIFNQLSTTPSDTDAGSSQLYLKDNGGLYLKNASNTEVALLTGADTTSVWVSGNGAGNINYTGGNVGIGTASPSNGLHVYGDSANGEIKAERSSGTSILIQAQAAHGKIGNTTNHDLGLNTNNTTRVTIKNDGKVGIGTTVPSELLSVAGAVSATTTAKAWFNWSHSAGDFHRSYNMSSETDDGTGSYTFAFTTPMDDANYCVVMGSSRNGSSSGNAANSIDFHGQSVTGFSIRTGNDNGTPANHENVCAAIFDTA